MIAMRSSLPVPGSAIAAASDEDVWNAVKLIRIGGYEHRELGTGD